MTENSASAVGSGREPPSSGPADAGGREAAAGGGREAAARDGREAAARDGREAAARDGREAAAGGGQVPAARRALAVLRLLAASAGPLPASAIARELGLPRSSTYHLLTAMAEDGFVSYVPEDRRWGLGVAAFEIGSAYLRHGPLERLARPLLRRLVDRTGDIAQLGVLHGAETLYLLKEQPTRRQATLVTDVGVRMPAQLTASGLSMLAHLPAAQVRALFPGPLVDRTGRGPASLRELRRVLSEDARRGWSAEDGQVTEGFASIAACSFDHTGHPTAAITVTFRRETRPEETWPDLAAEVRRTAADLTQRLGGKQK